jgi:ribonuclease-3
MKIFHLGVYKSSHAVLEEPIELDGRCLLDSDLDDLRSTLMSSTRLSEYFINEYLLLNKNATKSDFQSEVISKVNTVLNYSFQNTDLLIESLTHKSFSHESRFELAFNERLEFLGDAILDLIVSDKIFKLFGESPEGELSKLRSTIVNETTLSHIAQLNKLDSIILLGKGEIKNNGFNKAGVLSDCFEAVIGAIYLDSNFEKVKDVVFNVFIDYEALTGVSLFDLKTLINSDPKSKLQEITMKEFQATPKYESEEIVENKQKVFKVSLLLKEQVLATETNISKKKAMQNLASKVLKENIYKTLQP